MLSQITTKNASTSITVAAKEEEDLSAIKDRTHL